MSDDFNQRPPNQNDDDRFDWQPDEPEDGQPGQPPESGRLGFTGELAWRSDVERAFDDQPGQTGGEAFDWQADDPAWTESDAPGADEGGDDLPPWLASIDEQDNQPQTATGAGSDLPPWLADFGDEQPETAAEPDFDAFEQAGSAAAGADLPPWLRDEIEAEDSAPAEAPDLFGQQIASDAPPWLRDEIEAEDSEPAEAHDLFGQQIASDAPPWLAGFGDEGGQPPEAEAVPEPAADWQPGVPVTASQDDLLAELDEALGLTPEPVEIPPDGLEAYLVEEVVDEDFFDQFSTQERAIIHHEALALDVEIAEYDEFEQPEQPELDAWLAEAAPAGYAESEQPEQPELDAWLQPETADDDEFEQPELEDWLAEAAPAEPSPGGAQDIFAELGLPTPETGYDFIDQPQDGDWFDEQPGSGSPGWLDELGQLDLADVMPEAEVEQADDEMLAALLAAAGQDEADEDELPLPDFDLTAPALQDIESLLASYESPVDTAPADDRALLDPRVDIDRLLSDTDLEQIAVRRSGQPAPDLSPDAPDWLSEMGISVGEVSAAAMLRKQAERERPLDELDDRLLALHERGLDLPRAEESAAPADLKDLLPGITEFIATTPVRTGATGATGITGEMILTPQQTAHIKLLRSLAAADAGTAAAAAPPSAIDATLEAASFEDIMRAEGELESDLEGEPEEAAALAAQRARRRTRRLKLDRLLITLLVAAAVLLPFLTGMVRLGDLPPGQFAAGSSQQAAFDQMQRLAPGDLVLVAVEYGPTGAAELDNLTDVLLRHALLRGARPVVVSSNALGLLHAHNILERLAADDDLLAQLRRPPVANRDYYVIRYIAGSVVGLRAFSQNVAGLISTDITGGATGLTADSLNDFAVMVLLAERAEDLRAWAEQVTPLANRPLVAAVGFAAAPLSEPYVLLGSPQRLEGLRGLLIGYGDAYTYRAQLSQPFAAPQAVPTLPPVETPLPAREDTPAPQAAESTAEGGPGDETAPETPVEIEETSEAADEESAAQAEADDATASPTAAPEATAAPELPVIIGVIVGEQVVNVREGPGRTFALVGTARPGDRVRITGRSGDGQWLQIRLEDDREGWIAASLLRIEEPPTPTPESASAPQANPEGGLILAGYRPAPLQELPTPTPESFAAPDDFTPEPPAADTPQPESPVESPPEAPAVPPPPSTYAEERWYGMTLGLVVIISVIILGALVNIIGSLFRRRGR